MNEPPKAAFAAPIDPDARLSVTTGNVSGGRRCGDCQLCCKLLPVVSINKPGGQRCQHQRVGKGCMVYRTKLPMECSLWSCRWLTDPKCSGLSRPDRSHYVVDVMPDLIRGVDPDGAAHETVVLQVWVDPAFPHAHRDPALRAYLAAENLPALVRYSSSAALLLIPPGRTPDGAWWEIPDSQMTRVPTEHGTMLHDAMRRNLQ